MKECERVVLVVMKLPLLLAVWRMKECEIEALVAKKTACERGVSVVMRTECGRAVRVLAVVRREEESSPTRPFLSTP